VKVAVGVRVKVSECRVRVRVKLSECAE